MSRLSNQTRRKFLILIVGAAAIGGTSLLGLDLINKPRNSTSTNSTFQTRASETQSSTQLLSAGQSSSIQSSSSLNSTIQSESTASQSTSSSIVPWSNLRGVCYPVESLNMTSDATNNSPPTQSFEMMKALGFNMCRIDKASWQSLEHGGTLSDGSGTLTSAQYLVNIEAIASAADAAGFNLVWNGQLGLGLNSMTPWNWTTFWNNGPFWGTEAEYQGLSVWEAIFQGFWTKMVGTLDSHPSTLAYKIINEPQNVPSPLDGDSVLHNLYQYMAGRIRTISQKPIEFEPYGGGGGGNPASVTDIQKITPTSNLAPFLLGIHYPNSSQFSAFGQLSAQVQGLSGWYIDEWGATNGFSSANLQLCKQFGIPNLVFAWYVNSLLDTNENPTATCTNVSTLDTQILGPAQF